MGLQHRIPRRRVLLVLTLDRRGEGGHGWWHGAELSCGRGRQAGRVREDGEVLQAGGDRSHGEVTLQTGRGEGGGADMRKTAGRGGGQRGHRAAADCQRGASGYCGAGTHEEGAPAGAAHLGQCLRHGRHAHVMVQFVELEGLSVQLVLASLVRLRLVLAHVTAPCPAGAALLVL